jgi:hypothetical protein
MKKKPERYSFKKLAAGTRKPDLKYLEDINTSYEKGKSQPKNKSSERIIAAYETNSKFKIVKTNQERGRVRTEVDETANSKSPFQKFILQNKRNNDDRLTKGKSHDKGRQLTETKNLNLKKLNLGADLCTSPLTQIKSKTRRCKKIKPRTAARTTVSAKPTNHTGQG